MLALITTTFAYTAQMLDPVDSMVKKSLDDMNRRYNDAMVIEEDKGKLNDDTIQYMLQVRIPSIKRDVQGQIFQYKGWISQGMQLNPIDQALINDKILARWRTQDVDFDKWVSTLNDETSSVVMEVERKVFNIPVTEARSDYYGGFSDTSCQSVGMENPEDQYRANAGVSSGATNGSVVTGQSQGVMGSLVNAFNSWWFSKK